MFRTHLTHFDSSLSFLNSDTGSPIRDILIKRLGLQKDRMDLARDPIEFCDRCPVTTS